MFNPIPTDAPEFFSDKAHYIDFQETNNRSSTENRSNRFFKFTLGRSVKTYCLRDKGNDDTAFELLKRSMAKRKRLVLKGYISPSSYSPTMFAILTHFGIYHRLKEGYMVVNPDTGEEGYYKLMLE